MKGLLRHKLHWWKLRLQWYQKRLILSQPPYFINLEPTGYCNLKCVVCSYKQDRGKGYIDVDLAKKVLTDAAQFGVSQVRFFLAGEPIFHPHLDVLIRDAKAKGLLTQLHTNANYLDEKRATRLLDSGLDAISFSFDGENKEDYESIRVGGDFESTLGHIIRFLELKKDRRASSPYVTFQVIKPYREGAPFVPRLCNEFKKRLEGLPIERLLVLYPFAWPGQEQQNFNRPVGSKVFPCPVLWQSLSVGWDGRVFGCCGDLNGVVTLGDMNQERLSEIWNNDKIISMRKMHVENRHKDIPLCRDCDAVFIRVHPAIRDVKDLLTGRWNPL